MIKVRFFFLKKGFFVGPLYERNDLGFRLIECINDDIYLIS